MNNLSDIEKTKILDKILVKVDQNDKQCIRDYFIADLHTMNTHAYEVLNCYCILKYNQLDNYLKKGLYSTYPAWFCYMNDKDFLKDYKEFVDKENDQVIIGLMKNDPVFKAAFNKLKQSIV